MRHRLRAFALGIVLVVLGITVGIMPGCSFSYPYDLRVTVRDTTDARPIGGVKVTLRGEGLHAEEPTTWITAAYGTLEARLHAWNNAFFDNNVSMWAVVLTKDGYHEEVVDISPTRKPESGQAERRIVVIAYLRPKKEK